MKNPDSPPCLNSLRTIVPGTKDMPSRVGDLPGILPSKGTRLPSLTIPSLTIPSLTIPSLTRRLSRSHRGASLAEFGLLVSLVAAVAIGAVFVLGQGIRDSLIASGDSVSIATNSVVVAARTGNPPDLSAGSPPPPETDGALFSFSSSQGALDLTQFGFKTHGFPTFGGASSVEGFVSREMTTRTTGGGQAVYAVEGNRLVSLEGTTLSCDNGIALSLDGASTRIFIPGENVSVFSWNGYAGPLLVDGVGVSCAVS